MNMNTIERRALYNLLRMNWLNEPSLPVEPWQVEDYRDLSLSTLFDKLKQLSVHLDRTSFIAYADESDSPEDLTNQLIGDRQLKVEQEDQIYLLIFELWRRLMSEKPSLSVFCNELDHQIFLYDQGQIEDPLTLQDALANFKQILDENVDEGIPPEQAIELISAYCANDIETFLYDFILEQIDEGNESFAEELLDDFYIYLANNKWFALLRLRLFGHSHSKAAQKLAEEILEVQLNDQDLSFNLEFLSFLLEWKDYAAFHTLIQKAMPLIEKEEDFQDLLSIAIDYFHLLGQKQQENSLQSLLSKRANYPLEAIIPANDPDLSDFAQLFSSEN